MNKLFFLLVVVFIHSSTTFAQQLKSKIDSSKVKLGGQAHLNFELTISDHSKYSFPIFIDTIISGIELVGIPIIDTLKSEKGKLIVRQNITITSFTSGSYQIPQQKILVESGSKTDTLLSENIKFEVIEQKVDTTQAPRDIKAQIDTPVIWAEYTDLIYTILLIIFIIGIAIVIFILYKKRKTIPIFNKKTDPPHIVALSKLAHTKEVKIWQQGKHKEYHSEISDTLRQYLEEAFKLPAMEKTSDEILQIIKHSGMFSSELQDKMRVILTTADFAKFAKAEPLADENEISLNYAIDFVEKTKPQQENINKVSDSID